MVNHFTIVWCKWQFWGAPWRRNWIRIDGLKFLVSEINAESEQMKLARTPMKWKSENKTKQSDCQIMATIIITNLKINENKIIVKSMDWMIDGPGTDDIKPSYLNAKSDDDQPA